MRSLEYVEMSPLLLWSLIFASRKHPTSPIQKPNVVLIVADDLGESKDLDKLSF